MVEVVVSLSLSDLPRKEGVPGPRSRVLCTCVPPPTSPVHQCLTRVGFQCLSRDHEPYVQTPSCLSSLSSVPEPKQGRNDTLGPTQCSGKTRRAKRVVIYPSLYVDRMFLLPSPFTLFYTFHGTQTQDVNTPGGSGVPTLLRTPRSETFPYASLL